MPICWEQPLPSQCKTRGAHRLPTNNARHRCQKRTWRDIPNPSRPLAEINTWQQFPHVSATYRLLGYYTIMSYYTTCPLSHTPNVIYTLLFPRWFYTHINQWCEWRMPTEKTKKPIIKLANTWGQIGNIVSGEAGHHGGWAPSSHSMTLGYGGSIQHKITLFISTVISSCRKTTTPNMPALRECWEL